MEFENIAGIRIDFDKTRLEEPSSIIWFIKIGTTDNEPEYRDFTIIVVEIRVKIKNKNIYSGIYIISAIAST